MFCRSGCWRASSVTHLSASCPGVGQCYLTGNRLSGDLPFCCSLFFFPMFADACPPAARMAAGRWLWAWRGFFFPARRSLHRWRGCRLVGRQSLQLVRRCRAGRQAQDNRPLAAGCSSHTCAWRSSPMAARTPAGQQWLTMRLCSFLPKWLPESWRNYAFVCAKLGCRPMLSNGQLFVIQSAAGLRLENLVPMLAVAYPPAARTAAGRWLGAWRGCSFPTRRSLRRWRGCRLVWRQSPQPVRRCWAGRQAQDTQPLAAGGSSHPCAGRSLSNGRSHGGRPTGAGHAALQFSAEVVAVELAHSRACWRQARDPANAA